MGDTSPDPLQLRPRERMSIPGIRSSAASLFDALCSTIDAVRGHAKIYLRINLDKDNQKDAYRLADYFHERSWLFPGSRVCPYLAHIGPLSDICHSVESAGIERAEFDLMNIVSVR